MEYKAETIKTFEERINNLQGDLKIYLQINKNLTRLRLPEYRLEGDKLVVKMIKNIAKEIQDLKKFLEGFAQE